MRQSTRLIVNTIARFTGTALNVSLSLVTARLLLHGLGKKDFGLLSALGAAIIMSNPMTPALARAAARQMAFEIGRGDRTALRRAFHTTLVIFLVFAGLFFIAGELAQPLLIQTDGGLEIPSDRLDAANWAYQFTLVQWCVVMAITPLLAALNAAQQSILLSVNEVTGRINVLIASALVIYLPGDRLVTYTFILTALMTIGIVGPIFGVWRYCPDCRPGFGQFDRSEGREIGRFAAWSILQNLGANFCNQAGVVILYRFFKDIVAAAFALAQRAAVSQTMFAGAILNPIMPALVGYHARDQHEQVETLVHATSKFLAIMNMVVWVPFMLESSEVFALWLGDYPGLAPAFTRLLVTSSLISALGMGYCVALEARGQIATAALVSNMPLLAATAIVTGYYSLAASDPMLLPWVMLATTAVTSLLILPLYIGRKLNIGLGHWLRQVLRPAATVMACSLAAAGTLRLAMPEGLARVLAVSAASSATILIATWFFALADWERHHFARVALAGAERLSLVKKRTPVDSKDATADLAGPRSNS